MSTQLDAKELLKIWEKCLPLTKSGRALILAAFASNEAPDVLNHLSIGQCNEMLFQLRERLFGSHVHCLVACAMCGEQLELDFELDQITIPTRLPSELLEIEAAGYLVQFRLPTRLDLAALVPGDQTLQLLERCVLAAKQDGKMTNVANLPAEVVAAVSTEMSRIDPQGNIQLELVCPACDHGWSAIFDIVGFLWIELDWWAKRTLNDVHMLATAYGWREADILTLSPERRQHYIQLVIG